jgi:hypothetical protein
MVVGLLEYPTDEDWMEVKRRALVTSWKRPTNPPDDNWKRWILEARHSPIRYLRFSFYMAIPYWVSVHLCRHVHAQPYVASQRNDRQDMYDRNKAPQDAEVTMIWDLNAEELMVVMNKRLCNTASEETRKVVGAMRDLVLEKCPEFEPFLVPMCEYHGGTCHEMFPCGVSHNDKCEGCSNHEECREKELWDNCEEV